jgi:hypothetical protein
MCSILEELQQFIHTCCVFFTNIVCFSDDWGRSVQDMFQTCRFVAVTFTRKSAVAAVSVDL